jgi:large conductance mechanosensitive channel
MVKEFVGFLTKTNALALAIGVIIGAASGKLVTAVVEDLMMPIIGLLMPADAEWKKASFKLPGWTDAKPDARVLPYGDLLGNLLDFVIISFVVFMIAKVLIKPEPEAPDAPTKDCPFCKDIIPADATKCRSCTSEVA